MLTSLFSKSFKLGFSSTKLKNFHMYRLGFEEKDTAEVKLTTFTGLRRKQGNSRNTSTSAPLTALNLLTLHITIKYEKILKRWEYLTILLVS